MAQYKTGTANVVNGSEIVTGNGTKWLANATVGNSFKLKGINAVYSIISVDGDEQIKISPNWAGATQTGIDYQIVRDFTPTLNLPEVWKGDKDWPFHITTALRRIDSQMRIQNMNDVHVGTSAPSDPTAKPIWFDIS